MARLVRKVRSVYCSKPAYAPRGKERGHEHQWSFSSRLYTVAPEGFPFSSLFRFSGLGSGVPAPYSMSYCAAKHFMTPSAHHTY